MIEDLTRLWRYMALRAAAAILFGVATLIWPHVTLSVLVLLFGAFAMVDGLVTLGEVLVGDVRVHRGFWTVVGLAGVAAGVVTFAWPGITALALLYVIAVWAIVAGVTEIRAAVRLRELLEGEWALGLAGVLSLALAGFLLFRPGTGALVVTWAIGWFAVLFGASLAVLARRLHRVTRGLEAQTGRHGPTTAAGPAMG